MFPELFLYSPHPRFHALTTEFKKRHALHIFDDFFKSYQDKDMATRQKNPENDQNVMKTNIIFIFAQHNIL